MKQKQWYGFMVILLFSSHVWGVALKVGNSLPPLKLLATDGQSWRSQQLKGSSLSVLYFFSAQCASCVDGLKSLQEIVDQAKDQKFSVVAIGKESSAQLKAFAHKQGIRFPVLAGNRNILKAFNALYIYPTTYVIGPDQKVINVLQGGSDAVHKMVLALAERYLQRKNFVVAKTLYGQVEKASREDAITAKSGIGFSLLKEGKLAEAETVFEELGDSVQAKEGLAEVYVEQGKMDQALVLVNDVIAKDDNRSSAHMTKSKILYHKGDKQGAEQEIVKATDDSAVADHNFQISQAHYIHGNIERQNNKSDIALVSYEKAVENDPYNVDALSNQGVALQELGEPEKALEIFQKVKKIDPKDRLVYSLMRQAQAAIAQKQDIERQKYIDTLVTDLLTQYEKDKNKPPKADQWTSPVLSLSILGFKGNDSLMGRAGLESVLQEELTRALAKYRIKVVDRALLEKLLAELKLGSSALTDPDASLKLGKILAARFISMGGHYQVGDKQVITLRVVETETTNIVLNLSEQQRQSINPSQVAEGFAKAIGDMIDKDYPLKGRLAFVEDDTIIINLGKKHGVTPGLVFNVLGDETPIKLNGRILGYKKSKLGKLEVTEVDDLMAYAKVKTKTGKWQINQKIILSH